jgi:acetyl esterase/lipase
MKEDQMATSQAAEIVRKRVLHRIDEMDAVDVRRDLACPGADGEPLDVHLYRSSTAADARLPAVVLVPGYPGPGMRKVLGCGFTEIGSTVSWAELIAASGMAAIAYDNRQPAADLRAVLAWLRTSARTLSIDPGRIGLWASSGNVPVALAALMDDGMALRCAAFLYGYMLDLDGSTGVADASHRFGFVNASADRAVRDLARGVPLFIARAGRDEMPGLNDGIDRFVARALAANLSLTLTNHADGPHAFDLFDDSAATRHAVDLALAFLRGRLSARSGDPSSGAATVG